MKAPEPDQVPPGLQNAFFFAMFNAFSFQIVLGGPMVLYAKSLGGSATVLGIIAGMAPLMMVLQIPASYHMPRYGYRKFVYSGWGVRVLFIFFTALVPLTGSFLAPGTQLVLVLFCLFCFNLSRGISSCAWLPWITSLLPAGARGWYLARDAAFINVASFAGMQIAGRILGTAPAPWQFSVAFGFSAMAGAISLGFLKRVPDAEMPEAVRTSRASVPWLAISRHPPFRKLLWLSVVWSIAFGGFGTFSVAYLKTEAGMTESGILAAVSVSFLGGLSSLWLLGSRLDRLGSKPVLLFSIVLWIGIASAWLFLAGKTLTANRPVILVLEFLMGLGAALVNMAMIRLAMSVIPVMGRAHFFALYSVVGSLSLGSAPILWGLIIDLLRPLEQVWHGLEWNRYSVFFALTGLAFLAAAPLVRRLHEPEAASMEELLRDLLIGSLQRVWAKWWPRI